jgi:hypothetical protein
MSNWKTTQIWQRLVKINNDQAEDVRSFLSSKDCLNKIEKILNTGGTSPKDFTLHDGDHSFRVAERMWEIIPTATKKILSEYELALLLLSAYLHDIGMTPEYKMVNNHFVCLNTKNKQILNQSEKISFQKWLDEIGEQVDLEKDVIEDFEKATELIIFYCREKHNDWSELWIRNNFKDKELGNYTNWVNDLVNICRSHHYGLDELKTEKYNPFKINGKVVHRRYIAMCLRLADVIEIDPERAPEVLISHRGIIKGSISHWLKEKFTSVEVTKEGCISITAYPKQAFIHKAINDITEQIEKETLLCNTLIGEIPLRNISPTNDLEHVWNIIPSVHSVIKEAGNYEFIDGTFRPNSKKLLQLLAGTELYGNPLLAIRELVQNAIDAIKVQIGYRVLEDGISDSKEIEILKNKFKIELTVLKEGENYWVTCKDNGVGMDKDIIKKCFLVGGAAKRHELLDLERRCNEFGYNLETTGQFGIGVMSYFMIADKVIIKTKKSILSTNHEANAWEFEINGLSDFGELRKLELNGNGTEIQLRIKKEFSENFENSEKLLALLNNSLIRLPCNFAFKSLIGIELEYKPGWCKDVSVFKTKLINSFNNSTSPEISTSSDFISDEKQSVINTSNKRKHALENDFQDSIDFIICEGKLKGDNGFFRVHIPVFKNKKGESFAFFFEQQRDKDLFLYKINEGFLFMPAYNTADVSWKGIGIKNVSNYNREFPFSNCFIELDLINDKSFQISVSRLEIKFVNAFESIINEIKEQIQKVLKLNQKRFTNSIYSLFNSNIASCLNVKKENQYWSYESGYSVDYIKFQAISFPIIFDISTEIGKTYNELYNKNIFNRLEYIYGCGSKYGRGLYSIRNFRFRFDRAVYHPHHNFRISFLRTTPFAGGNDFSFIGNTASYPPEWNKLFCFRGYHEHDLVVNENNQLFKNISKDDFEHVKRFFKNKSTLNSKEGEAILSSKAKCTCFVLYLISLNEKSNWAGVTKSNPEFINKLWKKLFKDDNEIIYYFFDGISETKLIAISKDNWVIYSNYNDIVKHLPIPDIEWRIEARS